MSTDLSPLSAQRMPPVMPLTGAAITEVKPQAQATVAQPKEAAGKKDAGPNEQMRENIREATQRLNEQMQIRGRKLSFEIDEMTDQIVVTVKDLQSGDVIRQIPSEALLRVAHNMEQIKGLLHNEKT